ncbi:DMT family transporter [Sphaerisporangium sp. NPDC051017]|uniref:DMT family transporter n=1 Tax=Sphaerisporangium sp. NPDC051017 TaxID=3154636 RepID=UPI0034145010
MVIGLSLVAACLLGLGFVAQQHAAYREPLSQILHPRLLLDLVHMPLWLAGIGLMFCGQILSAIALGQASVAAVEPLLATSLLFALVAAHMIYQQHFSWVEWLGAVLVSGGVALFLAFGEPRQARGHDLPDPGSPRWLAMLLAAGLSAVLVVIALRVSLQVKAMLLAAAAGVLYGMQDVLTHSTLITLDNGVGAVAQTWQPYIVPCVAIVGLLLNQSAFDAAPLRVSLPATTATEPVIGILLGIVIFAERLHVAPGALAAEVAGLTAMVTGILLLGRSPFLAKRENGALQRQAGER